MTPLLTFLRTVSGTGDLARRRPAPSGVNVTGAGPTVPVTGSKAATPAPCGTLAATERAAALDLPVLCRVLGHAPDEWLTGGCCPDCGRVVA